MFWVLHTEYTEHIESTRYEDQQFVFQKMPQYVSCCRFYRYYGFINLLKRAGIAAFSVACIWAEHFYFSINVLCIFYFIYFSMGSIRQVCENICHSKRRPNSGSIWCVLCIHQQVSMFVYSLVTVLLFHVIVGLVDCDFWLLFPGQWNLRWMVWIIEIILCPLHTCWKK